MTQSDSQRDRAMVKTPQPPYFEYVDFSGLADPDPPKSLTAPGRIPTFPAKMIDILSRPELAHIISWMPHGRSWKVHKPKEFQVNVIPTYFEHSKLSSFIRQANGWGFRRMAVKGRDQGSYYHEMFLRGKPHLIKLMKRSNNTPRPSSEPDFYKIAAERPLSEAHSEETIDFLETKMKTKDSHESRVSMKDKNNHSYLGWSSSYPCPIERSPLEPFPSYRSSCQGSSPRASFMDDDHQWTREDTEQYQWPWNFDDPMDGGLSHYDMEPVPLSRVVSAPSVHAVSPAPPQSVVHRELQFYADDLLFPEGLSPSDFW
jgi:hypothetical protein